MLRKILTEEVVRYTQHETLDYAARVIVVTHFLDVFTHVCSRYLCTTANYFFFYCVMELYEVWTPQSSSKSARGTHSRRYRDRRWCPFYYSSTSSSVLKNSSPFYASYALVLTLKVDHIIWNRGCSKRWKLSPTILCNFVVVFTVRLFYGFKFNASIFSRFRLFLPVEDRVLCLLFIIVDSNHS